MYLRALFPSLSGKCTREEKEKAKKGGGKVGVYVTPLRRALSTKKAFLARESDGKSSDEDVVFGHKRNRSSLFFPCRDHSLLLDRRAL